MTETENGREIQRGRQKETEIDETERQRESRQTE